MSRAVDVKAELTQSLKYLRLPTVRQCYEEVAGARRAGIAQLRTVSARIGAAGVRGAETHEMGEEIRASYLYQVHLYQWLEANRFGPALTDSDL